MPKVTEEHRLARRDQIIAAAQRCVLQRGFHKTTMADVIRESRLSAGAVYSYFKSKDDIIAAIADNALSGAEALFDRLLASDEPLTPAVLLTTAVRFIEEVATGPAGDIMHVAIQAWAEAAHNEEIRGIAQDKYRRIRGHFVRGVQRMQADGTVSPDADAEYVAQVLFSLVPGYILQRAILGDLTPETFAAGLAAVLR